MNRTLSLFEERKSEIEFYYSILTDIDTSNGRINTIDNPRFERILKSNFLLMLYNLIEACISSGFIEIYEAIENHGISYVDVISELQKKWSDYKVSSQSSESTANQNTYKKIVASILDDVLAKKPLSFQTNRRQEFIKNVLGVSGNLDARQIRDLLSCHKIDFSDQMDKPKMYIVKQKRNQLAHGEESFENSARDYSVSELEAFKDEVLTFIQAVLVAMQGYYDDKKYVSSV